MAAILPDGTSSATAVLKWLGGSSGRGRTAVEGFSEFVASRYPALVRYGVLLTGDRGHGEDLVQSAPVKAYRAWGRLHPEGSPWPTPGP
jgi:DNA-directed RNA polymerase specialized sigma24 family protein